MGMAVAPSTVAAVAFTKPKRPTFQILEAIKALAPPAKEKVAKEIPAGVTESTIG